jgi:hypothetical protein
MKRTTKDPRYSTIVAFIGRGRAGGGAGRAALLVLRGLVQRAALHALADCAGSTAGTTETQTHVIVLRINWFAR